MKYNDENRIEEVAGKEKKRMKREDEDEEIK